MHNRMKNYGWILQDGVCVLEMRGDFLVQKLEHLRKTTSLDEGEAMCDVSPTSNAVDY